MNSKKIPTTRGRKPIGSTAMTAAERKQRSRERIRATGAKDFLMRVEGFHLEVLESLAEAGNVSVAEAFRNFMEPSLDRFAGLVKRCNTMRENGASDEEVAVFMQTHLFPPLPPIEEKEKSPSDSN